MKLYSIMDIKLLTDMTQRGYVRAQRHPQLPYLIYNYTSAAQYENVWNDVTEQCRGLIVHAETSDIVARPFRKFFNYGQAGAPILPLDAQVHVTDKADGSLGILYPTPGLTTSGYSIATRGSFTSEQAIHATEVFNSKYGSRWAPHPSYTYLFEIVYPANRIVLNYGDTDDLFMLTAINNISGWSIPHVGHWSNWPGPTVQVFKYGTFKEALEASPRSNAEGLVIHDLRTDARVKIKQADYIAMHKILTGITARMVWRYLAVNACKHLVGSVIKQPSHWGTRLGIDVNEAEHIIAVGDDWVDKFTADMPDELYAWLENTIRILHTEVVTLRRRVEIDMHTYAAMASNDGPFNRGQFFRMIQERAPDHWGLIGAMYDKHDITAQLWKAVYPNVERAFKYVSEDSA